MQFATHSVGVELKKNICILTVTETQICIQIRVDL